MQRHRNRAETCPVKWRWDLAHGTANRSNEARLDVWAHGFGERGQQAFYDLRFFDPNACRYLNKSLTQCQVMNENEKERAYNERVLKADHCTFTPLVSSIYENMGKECHSHKFYSWLSDVLLSKKHNLPKSVVANWVRSKICFALLKSSLFCLRSSRTICRKASELEYDVDTSHGLAKI